MDNILKYVIEIANLCRENKGATFDQLAEEVMELHLAMRGKSPDGHIPEMEWLEIATIAINALRHSDPRVVKTAYLQWLYKHHRPPEDI